MKISEVIRFLTELKDEVGDRVVLLSCDSEGNSFGDIDYSADTNLKNYVILFPQHEQYMYEDLEAEQRQNEEE